MKTKLACRDIYFEDNFNAILTHRMADKTRLEIMALADSIDREITALNEEAEQNIKLGEDNILESLNELFTEYNYNYNKHDTAKMAELLEKIENLTL